MAAKDKRGKKPPNIRRTVSDYAKALEMAQGFKSLAAYHLGVQPSAMSMAIKRHPSLGKLQKKLEEDRMLPILDVSESKLSEAVQEGKAWAIKYLLDNHGAERGYGRKIQLSGKVDSEVSPGDPLAVYKDMPSEQRRRLIAQLLERAKVAQESS